MGFMYTNDMRDFRVYLNSIEDVRGVATDQLWRYYIDREVFMAIPIDELTNDARDPLVGAAEMASSGISVEPIWLDAPIDEEGEEYARYLQENILNDLPGYLRPEVATRLIAAAATLKTRGYTLVLKAGYRPLVVQQRLFARVHQMHNDYPATIVDQRNHQGRLKCLFLLV